MARRLLGFVPLIYLLISLVAVGSSDAKSLGFSDPNTKTAYRVESTNPHEIIVSRVGRDEVHRIQKLPFKSAQLIDFDINCLPTHCYLVAVTDKATQNVELFAWDRVQFDMRARRDSFANPYSVKLFRIHSGFYIAVAQDQLHLSSNRPSPDEQPRFIGCAVFKFLRGYEKNLRYHQFIKLPFDPKFVRHFISTNPNNISLDSPRPSENHYLVFSPDSEWNRPGSSRAYSFIWSPLNDLFWPYKLPVGVEVVQPPGSQRWILKFPTELATVNLTGVRVQDPSIQPVESCFAQLERLLSERQLQAKKLIDTSTNIWRSSQWRLNAGSLTDISAQVIVHGNVHVRGSMIESPQISLMINRPSPINIDLLESMLMTHSPTLVDNKLKQALYRLKIIREKLSRAVPATDPSPFHSFNSRIRFMGTITADQVIFGEHGVANSNMRLNGLPFRQLEHELVSLRGAQDIGATVIFTGNVTADLLEIHGLINNAYYLKDAVDVTSTSLQVISNDGIRGPNQDTLNFRSVGTSELILIQNSSFNDIQLGDFITRDSRPQYIRGVKSFRQLTMGQLDLASSHVALNGANISHIARNALRLDSPKGSQLLTGNYITFTKPVTVNRLLIDNLINRHINLTSLIIDSVKTFDVGRQQISGHKRFLQGLTINQLNTDGAINGIQIDQVFNLNPQPPLSDYARYPNTTAFGTAHVPITGRFQFLSPVTFAGNLTAGLINGIDITNRAIRRWPNSMNETQPQVVRGRKIFLRPLRVINSIDLLDRNQYQMINSPIPFSNPLINGFDLRQVNADIQRQMENPKDITIDTLEIDGNLYLDTSYNQTRLHTLGTDLDCPLDIISSKLILTGQEEQIVDTPIKVKTLKARSVFLEPGALNNLNFPSDFVLRSGPRDAPDTIEPVFGHKSFDHLIISPPTPYMQPNMPVDIAFRKQWQNVVFGSRASINNISYPELQTFVSFERQKNSTGETLIQSLDVYGNIYAKRINGYIWPDDILLKSFGATQTPPMSPNQHRRIYSPLVFLNTSNLIVRNQLVLRGPIQLAGRLNGVNLTEFMESSVTYGDKDLLSGNRPLRNKVFLGGLTVNGEVLSQGLIDGVNFDEMKARVVTIGPSPPGQRMLITGQKSFLSDVEFNAPVHIEFFNDIRLDSLLPRIKPIPYTNIIPIFGKKTISGTLKINKNLIVQGLINGIDFLSLEAKSITLSPTDNLRINKTVTIEGNVFMDNLLMDEKKGIIDGVKLASLVPIDSGARSFRPDTPVAVHYEPRRPTRSVRATHPDLHNELLERQLYTLRRRFINLDLFNILNPANLVAGFIDSPSNNIANHILPEGPEPHYENTIYRDSFHLLDQYDFHFKLTVYHLSIGVLANKTSGSETGVYYSLPSSEQYRLSLLPIQSPNSAKFLNVANHTLFLLVSQDHATISTHRGGAQCPSYRDTQVSSLTGFCSNDRGEYESALGGLHIYLFHALQNSSDLRKSYFDLFQTMDLPPIDSFEGFEYLGSTYALAMSRYAEKVFLLVLRGYSGFQVVSFINVAGVDYVKIIHDSNYKPALIVHQNNGIHRLMEAVVI